MSATVLPPPGKNSIIEGIEIVPPPTEEKYKESNMIEETPKFAPSGSFNFMTAIDGLPTSTVFECESLSMQSSSKRLSEKDNSSKN